MFKITPIGSCRVTGPLRRGQSGHGFHLNLDRCYGYCHSPAEAVQLARFMQGDLSIPEDVWPLVSRSHDLRVISATEHFSSDLYVVELASAKEVTINGVSIQLNYLNSVYSDFFTDVGRATAFWNRAQHGDETDMRAFLDQHWSDTEQRLLQSETLVKIRLQLVTRESLRRNLENIVRILPDVLIVTHIDARKADNRPIKSRSEFIRLVAQEAGRAGCKFYDPSELMSEFGQTEAIEDESTGLAHFTDAFSDAIMEDWMRNFIAPKTDHAVRCGSEGVLERQFLPQIAAATREGRFADICARLKALSRDTDSITPLLTETERSQTTAQDTFSAEITAVEHNDLSSDERSKLVLTAAALGLFETALNLAVQTPSSLKSMSAYTLMRVADQANKAGDKDIAFEFLLATVCKDQTIARANKSLAELVLVEEIDVLSDLNDSQIAAIFSHIDPVQRLGLLHLNGAEWTAAVSEKSTPDEVAEIVSYLADHHGIVHGADVMAFWRTQQRGDRIADERLVDILNHWTGAALDFTEPGERIRGLNAVLKAAPRHSGARNALRDVRKQLALHVRAAGKRGDIDALDALALDVSALSRPLPELDLWRARLRYDLGDYDMAVELGQSASAILSETINVWVLLMRAARKSDDGPKAAEFAQRVIDLACTETEKLRSEAESVLQCGIEMVPQSRSMGV